jgi:O-antigen biosynthesis protein
MIQSPSDADTAAAGSTPNWKLQVEDKGQHVSNGTSAEIRRPRVEGKFLFVGNEKFWVKGTTYGAFPPNSRGDQFPEPEEVALDFGLMQYCGINSILTYTVPPVSLLDQAQEHGIRVIVAIPWMEYVCFLENRRTRRDVRREVKEAVASCQRHPAVLMFCVGKEIPPPIVRWHGAKKIENFLRELYETAKEEDPDSLVTYTNFPTTEYLELPFVDVFTFNVYLHQSAEMCAYLSRLQHRAGELPFVLTELGICSFRHGRDGQAKFLDWQIEEAFDHGLAGAVVFGWTDPFFQDNLSITEWGFGLVDADRRPKPSYWAVKDRFSTPTPFSPQRKWPRVTVVVAAYNAARTLDCCLDALTRLRYPDYEVIVVNDGSTDDTEAVMRRYPQFRGITTPNQGVSAARNEGLRAATGEIIAYIDSDADADPDWLSYLATTYLKSDVVGVGGPNLVPADDNWVAQCVYRSPGGPTQVMLDDQSAEHIPGCNMSFRKSALEEVGGFDPIFRTAADDVDICWRLLDRGYRIGFSPSAVVWHHRRPSVKAYWHQQVGYGVSESILERKFPNKFNPWGHTFWAGRIYGPYPTFRLLGRPVVYHGLWGSAGFQPMYEPGGGGVLSFLPRAMEWHVALAALLVLGFFFPWAFLLVALGLLYTAGYCIACAAKAKLDVPEMSDGRGWFRRLRWRAMITVLHFLEPLARDWGRLKGGLTPWRNLSGSATAHQVSPWWQRLQPFRRVAEWTTHGNMFLDKYPFLERLTGKLGAAGCAVGWNPNYENWELKIRRGALAEAKLRMVIEHHGGPRRLARISTVIHPPKSVFWVQGLLAVLCGILHGIRLPAPATLLAGSFLLLWMAVVIHAGRLEGIINSGAAEVADELQGRASPELEGEELEIARSAMEQVLAD